jgi:hypothetical protein
MARRLGLGVLVIATAAAAVGWTAVAQQQNWLIGDWLTTEMDPRGITNSALAVRFEPNGRAIVQMAVSGSGGSGTSTYFLTWRLTGPQSYTAQYVDYEPKQMCGVVCLPMPPLIPMGTVSNCQFQPLNQVAMSVSCDGQAPVRFTRQN